MTDKLIWEVIEDRYDQGVWRAEAIGPDGRCYLASFMTPEAERDAREYAARKNADADRSAK